MKKLFFGGVWALCLAGGAISGMRAGASAEELRVTREFVQASNNEPVAADLPAASLELELEPRAVVQRERGESLELDLNLTSRFTKAASVQYSYELVRDDGSRANTTERSPIRRLDAKNPVHAKITTPAGLEDGYYRARVIAVASDAENDVALTDERYFQVKGGSITPLSPSEWFAKSNANRAQPLREETK